MKRKHRQRGFTIATFALLLTALIGMAALAVDVGVLYTARTSAQHAADAAALAGAFTFINPSAAQPATATNAAIAVAAKNKVLGQAVSISAANVTVDTANFRVTVTVPRTGDNAVATYFAKALGVNSADVQTKATAEAWQSGAAASCLKPIFLPNTILSTKDPAAACKAGEVMFTASGDTSQVTAWAKARLPMTNSTTIRPTSPSGALKPSQFFSLDFSNRNDPGANTYRCTLGDCLNQCAGVPSPVVCGTSFPIKTGNMDGPTQQGVGDLIGDPPTDTWIAPGQYQTPLGVSSTSRALVVAPVWDNCSQTIDSGYKGQSVKIIGFTTVFVAGWVNGKNSGVQAYIVGDNGCSGAGGSGAGSSSTASGPYGIPVRLVQNP